MICGALTWKQGSKRILFNNRWSKINFFLNAPCPREGHSCSIIRNAYLMIYGGLDEFDSNVSDIHLFDLRNFVWYTVQNIL